MGFFGRISRRTKKGSRKADHGSMSEDPKRYAAAAKVVAEAENLYQDCSGKGELRWSDSLVELSPESIRAISQRGWRKRGFAEPTNEFLVRVLGRIAAGRSEGERAQAIDVLQVGLNVPDDGTTGSTNIRNACISELDKLKAMPGVDYSQPEERLDGKPFRLEPIMAGDVGPIRTECPQEKPNAESAALWQLVLYPQQEYNKVVESFEANYPRWVKAFDCRSMSLVLCAYACALDHLGRYCEALTAHRWACKTYPYKGFTSCDILKELEAKATKALKEKRLTLGANEEICEYCFRTIAADEGAYVLYEKVTCAECNSKLRCEGLAGRPNGPNSALSTQVAESDAGTRNDTVSDLPERIARIIDDMGEARGSVEESLIEQKAPEILDYGEQAINVLIQFGSLCCDELEKLLLAAAGGRVSPPYGEYVTRLKRSLLILNAFCDASLHNRSSLRAKREVIVLLVRAYGRCRTFFAKTLLDKLGVPKRDVWRELLLRLPIVEQSKFDRTKPLEECLKKIETLVLDRERGLENPSIQIRGDCFHIGCSWTHAHELFRVEKETFAYRIRSITNDP